MIVAVVVVAAVAAAVAVVGVNLVVSLSMVDCRSLLVGIVVFAFVVAICLLLFCFNNSSC